MKSLLLSLLLSIPMGAWAQSAPTPLPGYTVQVTGGYSMVKSQQTNNGMFSSIAMPLYTKNTTNSFSVSMRADYFSISNPSTYVLLGGPELRYQFSNAAFALGAVFQPFGNAMIGVGRSSCVAAGTCATPSAGNSKIAYKIGGGVDVPMSPNTVLRLLEVDYIKSTLYPGGHVTLSNFAQFSSGIGIRF